MNIKPILLALCLLLSSSVAFCQDTSILDLHNGFGSLSFGKTLDELKKVTPLKRISKSSKSNEEIYTVKKVNDFSVFNYPIRAINLTFYKEQLFQIEIKMQDYTNMMQNFTIREDVYRKVVANYGWQTAVDTTLNTRVLKKNDFLYWSGNSVTLVDARPYDRAAMIIPSDPSKPNIFVGDTWYYINNRVAKQRYQELNLGKGL